MVRSGMAGNAIKLFYDLIRSDRDSISRNSSHKRKANAFLRSVYMNLMIDIGVLDEAKIVFYDSLEGFHFITQKNPHYLHSFIF